MNEKVRFVVLTGLLVGIFPITLFMIFVFWLAGLLSDMCVDYIKFYRETWK